jgi:hypothetical protein
MQMELGENTIKTATEKKAYAAPKLITHGSVAKLTQHNSSGGYSDMGTTPSAPHHRHRWWECL